MPAQPVKVVLPQRELTRGEQALEVIKRDPRIVEGLRELFTERRENRRAALEQAQGEVAISLRGRCLELTTILMDLFPEDERR